MSTPPPRGPLDRESLVPYGPPPELDVLSDIDRDALTLLRVRSVEVPPQVAQFRIAWWQEDACFLPYDTGEGWAVFLQCDNRSRHRSTLDFVRLVGDARDACDACADLNWLLGLTPNFEWRLPRLR